MITPASYARYSTDRQREESIEDQNRVTGRYADDKSWPQPQRYNDFAVSGQAKDRAEFDRMLADAEAGKFNVLLVTALSRLGRDSAEREIIMRRLEFWGIRIIAVSEGYDSDMAINVRKIHRAMSGIKDEAYIDDVARETHKGLTGKAENGYNAGGRTYGYKHIPVEHVTRLDKHGRPEIIGVRREIDPEQSAIVIEIFALYASGRSPLWIAKHLNDRGIHGPRSVTWSRSTIYGDKRDGIGILNNTLYIGQYTWNRSKWVKHPDTGRRKRVERDKAEWITQDMPELRIIDDDLWHKVQHRLNATRNKSLAQVKAGKNTGGRHPKYLFSGLLKCGVCGSNYVLVKTDKYGGAYGCANHKERGACTNSRTVMRTLVEKKLLDGLRQDLFSEDNIELFKREASQQLREAKRQQAPQNNHNKKRLAELDRQIANIVNAIAQGTYSQALQTALQTAEQERDQLQAQLTQPQQLDTLPDILPKAINRYRDMINDIETWADNNIAFARENITNIIGKNIPLHPTEDGGLEAEIGLYIKEIRQLVAGERPPVENGGSGGWIQTFSTRVRLI